LGCEGPVCLGARFLTTGESLQPQDGGAEDGTQQGGRAGSEIAQGEQAQLLELAQQLG
jgi:hypothetical protein